MQRNVLVCFLSDVIHDKSVLMKALMPYGVIGLNIIIGILLILANTQYTMTRLYIQKY